MSTSTSTHTKNTVHTTSAAARASEFISFGEPTADSRLFGDDVSTNNLECFTSIPFLGDSYNYLTFSSNGLACMGCRYTSYVPRELNVFLDRDIIAALWTDLVVSRSNEKMFYHLYSDDDDFGNRTLIDTVLNKVSSNVNYYSQTSDFSASCVYIATWENARLYGDFKTVTFQFILATNGAKTYAYSLFKDVNILLPPGGRQCAIGYSGLDGSSSSIYSFTESAFNVSELRGNTFDGVNGVYFMSLHAKGQIQVNPAAQCVRWYRRNVLVGRSLINSRWDSANICPCNQIMLVFDGRFIVFSVQNNVVCYANYKFGTSRICCYHQWLGFLLRNSPDAGTMVTGNPFTDIVTYQSDNVIPKENCCEKSDNCHLYYNVRPVGFCNRRSSFGVFFTFGDPHVDTLDGFQYTFNGWGEYTMMKIENENVTFEIQARTDLATSKNGTELKKINATIFSGFAAIENGNASMQVELASDLKTMVVYGNGNDYTTQFITEENFAVRLTGIVLRRQNHTLVVAFSKSGIQLKFQVKTRQLTLSASVHEEFKGQVTGLMGNFDGEKTNEFVLPNRTILSSGDVESERKLYNNFGQLWETTADNSIFDYTDGKSWADYSHQDFVPIFIDEFDNSTLQLAYTVCGGKSDQYKACIFDYLATGDQSFADDTQISNAEAESETAQLQNEAPEISGQESIKVVVNQSVVLNFTGQDDKADFRYSIIDQPGGDTFTSDNSTGNLTLTWTPANLNTEKIRVTTVDSDGLTADAIEVVIMACSGCSDDQGTCDYDNLRNESNPNYLIASCNCTTGWSGDDCDINTDSCADNPCALGRTCIDLTPPDEVLAGRGYNCSNCPPGYNITDDEKCEDIDECTERTSGCEQICANSDGSFTCSCVYGFELLADGKCNQNINECDASVCTQTCQDTVGSYTCSCYTGFKLNADKTSCSACVSPFYGDNCASQCSCGPGALRCDPSRGCVCNSAWTGTNCDVDVDECVETPGICQSDDKTCVNEDGGYECKCRSGYGKESANDSVPCADVNECTTESDDCEQDCVNNVGSYNCRCLFGYELNNDRKTCKQVSDPCGTLSNLTCSYACRLKDSTAFCYCQSGYVLQADNQTCRDINECNDDSKNLCFDKSTCSNIAGSFQCSCTIGQFLENDRRTCSDCDQFHWGDNCNYTCNCGAGAERCDSITGCVCKSGWQGTKCDADINECNSVVNPCDTSSNQRCVNTPGTFVCKCVTGYQNKTGTCTDVNECNDNPCDQLCTNTDRSYKCSCNTGFTKDANEKCQDINECDTTLNKCDQNCLNTPGSYKCSCNDGYLLSPTDQRKCTVKTQCFSFNCTNPGTCAVKSDGSEYCTCPTGYNLTMADNVTGICETLETTTQGNTTQEATTQQAITQEVTTQDGTTQEATIQEATTQIATTQEATTEQSSTTQATTQEAITQIATTQEATTKQTSTTQVATKQIATTQQVTVQEATTQEATTHEDATQEATTQEATTKQASTTQATTQEATTKHASTTYEVTPQEVTTVNTTTPEATTKVVTTKGATADKVTTQEKTTEKTTTEDATIKDETTTEVSVPKTTYTPMSGEIKVEVILTISVNPSGDLTNEKTVYYQELLNETFAVMTHYYSSSAATKNNFIRVVVYRISKGSLVVDHAVILNSKTTTGQNQVAAATNNLINGVDMLTFGAELTSPAAAGATTAVIYTAEGVKATITTSTTICGTLNTLNTCPTNQECSVNGNGVPYCASLKSTDNFPLIIGLGVGLPLFFLFLALIIVLYVYNSKRPKSNSLNGDDLDRTMPAHEGFFAGVIPGRFNSWNRPRGRAFHGHWNDRSVESERGAYDNEMFRGKDLYGSLSYKEARNRTKN
ncbi:Hypothetical predicted protein [Mytilus galloprovincialis]|uniref:Mucin-like protein n=1 Tax=Mytilus galloprovincialis TaxID=29158 RepID=A0A8B6ERV2_MYTGA|nr:Hypothetical predicted protein [Mytilus galloprovincialis]